ncbi:flippase [uncultured Dubosiella sp.]|uniref:flippase n=2 Tax=uncultured Dubosiella sp. TaxID=1937011 RepID=UPI0025B5FC27|nr:flippase [uncultured Dubosiella sp.]
MINIKKILKKKAVSNGVWLYLMQIFNTIIPILTLPYVTRVLGSSQFGIFSIALNLLGYYQVVVEYGFGMSATRKVVLLEKNNKKINKIFTCVLCSRIFLFTLCCLMTLLFYIFNPDRGVENICLIVLMIGLIGNCFQLNWLFQGLQQMKFISIVSILSRTISVILIFLFIKKPEDLYLYCFLYSSSQFINGILAIAVSKIKFSLKIVKITIDDVKNELKEGWYVFTTQLSSKVFGAIGITFLGMFASTSEVGIYSAINKIPNMIIFAWTPISQVLYPISSKKMKESYEIGIDFVKKMQIFFVPIAFFGAILLSFFSKYIIEIAFGEEYVKYFYWAIPLFAWLVVSINNNFWGIQALLGSGHDKEYSKCFQIGVVCTMVSNFVLIYFFKGNGACIAPLLSEIILGVFLYKELRKLKNGE